MGLIQELCDPVREFGQMGITKIAYEEGKGEEITTVSTVEFAEKEIPTYKEILRVMGREALLTVLGEQILRWDTRRIIDREPPKNRVFESNVLARILLPLIVNRRPTYSMAQVLAASHYYGTGNPLEPVPPWHNVDFSRFRPRKAKLYAGGMSDIRSSLENVTAHLCGGIVYCRITHPYLNGNIQLLQLSKRNGDDGQYRFSIPGGGHTKSRVSIQQSLPDVAGLREAREETDISEPALSTSVPLGLAVQVTTSTRNGGVVVYANYLWRTTNALATSLYEEEKQLVTFGHGTEGKDLAPWEMISDLRLTPLAFSAIQMLRGR